LLDTVEEKESQEALEAIQKAHPASAPLIVTAASAAKALHVAANGEVEPEVIESVLTMRGELDFHIAVMPEEIGGTGSSEQKAVIASLRDKGPSAPLTANGTQARWIPVEWHRQSDFKTGYVVESLDGDLYMLCYDDSARDNPGPKSLKHNDPARKPWHVSSRPPFYDPQSGVTLPFYLDPAGATYMGELSELNVNHPIALVLDGTVVSAPTIRAKFTDAGVITFGTDGGKRTRAQVEADAILLSRRLKAADMPSPLRRIP
jgi:preprotein translocase subunit SecD